MDSSLTRDLTVLEFFPILVAVVMCAKDFENKMVCFGCPNTAVVHITNSLFARLCGLFTACITFTLLNV